MNKILEKIISAIVYIMQAFGGISTAIVLFCIIYYIAKEDHLLTFENEEKNIVIIIILIVIAAVIFVFDKAFKISKYKKELKKFDRKEQKQEFSKCKNKIAKKKAQLILFVIFVISLIIFSAIYKTEITDYFATRVSIDTTSKVSESLPSDDTSTTTEKASYVSPKKINTTGNAYYQNNEGYLCEQDGVYYIATDNGLYSTTDSFNSFNRLNDVTDARNINVIGDYIYYSTEDGIYKMRLDGQHNQILIYTGCRVISMQVQNGAIYYIKATDSKLYVAPIQGGDSNILYNNEIHKFVINDAYIYVIDADIERFDSNNYPKRTRFKSISRILFDGSEKTVISDNWNINYIDIFNMAFSNNELYFLSNDGLYKSEYPFDNCTHLQNEYGTNGLAIVNNNAYYSCEVDKKTHFIKVDLNNNSKKDYGAIFDNSTQINWIFPTDDKIIVTFDSTWYSINISDGSFTTIQFDE